MKIVNINSGLGNQMFQFAFYLSLKDMYKNEDVKLDVSWFNAEDFHNGFELDRIFNLDLDYASKRDVSELSWFGYGFFSRLKRRFLYRKKSEIVESKEQYFKYKPELYGNEDLNLYYLGYWQSYKYFESKTECLKTVFTFPEFTENKNLELNSFIKNDSNRTVSIHVRLGDYLNDKSLGGICTLDYYKKAISEIEKEIKDPVYIIFSNDIEWCKENFKLAQVKFVDWNFDELSFRDMQLMSLCDHNIIANSSFSWWGAFLNSNLEKIVIGPKVWTRATEDRDLIPVEWRRV